LDTRAKLTAPLNLTIRSRYSPDVASVTSELTASTRSEPIMRTVNAFTAAAVLSVALGAPALAATCESPAGFSAFISEFKSEAARKGLSKRTLANLDGLTPDPTVLAADRRQGVFKQSYDQFGPPRINSRIVKASRLMGEYAPTLRRVEQQFGVPGGIVIALWGLETDFGTNTGKHEVLRSTATLAYDCRRSDMFQNELTEALTLIERGDVMAAELRGDWAGEFGQAHFLPSSYNKYAIDFDGNGRRDLIRSVVDTLGSTANYLKGYGWQAGQPWGEGAANFEVIRKWNRAMVYAKTVAAFGEKLEGHSARAERQ
jgi:membrane-bound lytic murein transglycosylase B